MALQIRCNASWGVVLTLLRLLICKALNDTEPDYEVSVLKSLQFKNISLADRNAQEECYRKSLYQDVDLWRQRAKLTIADLGRTVASINCPKSRRNARPSKKSTTHSGVAIERSYVALFIVKGGRVRYSWLDGRGLKDGYHHRGPCTASLLQRALEAAKPEDRVDSAFIVNTRNVPICALDICHAPIFSMYKLWPSASSGLTRDEDILFPVANYNFEDMYIYPWQGKRSVAMFRGVGRCSNIKACTRTMVAEYADTHPDLLDVQLTHAVVEHVGRDGVAQRTRGKHRVGEFVSMANHTRWKYLINMDGTTGSARLWQIMGTNSVVLKERSDWVDSHTRCLQEGVHVVGWGGRKDNVGELLDAVRWLHDGDERAHRIALNGLHFRYQYRHPNASGEYMLEAVRQYNSLFKPGEMKRYIDSLDIDGLPDGVNPRLMRQVAQLKSPFC